MKGGPSDWLTQWKSERERDDLKRLSTSALRTNWGRAIGKRAPFKSGCCWPSSLHWKLGSSLVLMQPLASAWGQLFAQTQTMSDLRKNPNFHFILSYVINYPEWVAHIKNTNLKYKFCFDCSRSKDTTLAGCHGSKQKKQTNSNST